MKKLLLFFFALVTLSSCSINDDDEPQNNILYAYAAIDEVVMPDAFVLGEEYEIKITYTNPSPCHEMFGFEYVPENQTHYFGIVSSFNPNDPLCSDEVGSTEEYVWKFRANRNEKYIFKFWTGIDSNGEAVFLTREVEVLE